MRVCITGASGLLGRSFSCLLEKRGAEVVAFDRSMGLSLENISSQFQGVDLVIHAAANTNVEWCEENTFECYRDNALFTELICSAAYFCGIKVVYVSSTGVYGAHKGIPYTEFDDVIPTTHHHKSKHFGENYALRDPRNLVVRTGWLFGGSVDNPKNFVINRIKEASLSSGVIYSNAQQFGSPTSVDDVALRVFDLISGGFFGVFNCVNSGVASRFDYVTEIVRSSGSSVVVKASEASFFNRKAMVSDNESAHNFKMKMLGLPDMPDWRDSLRSYVATVL